MTPVTDHASNLATGFDVSADIKAGLNFERANAPLEGHSASVAALHVHQSDAVAARRAHDNGCQGADRPELRISCLASSENPDRHLRLLTKILLSLAPGCPRREQWTRPLSWRNYQTI